MSNADKTKEFISRFVRNHELQLDDDIFALGFVNSLFAMQLVLFVEQEERFIVVGDAGFEIAVVRMPDEIIKKNPLSVPPRVREEMPVKPSFLVEDLSLASEALARKLRCVILHRVPPAKL